MTRAPAESPDAASSAPRSDAVWTIPNAISALRIVLIGIFLYLLVTERDALAVAALVVAGFSDFLDGYLARRWNQSTRLGRVLDPAADRLLTVAVVIGLGIRDVIPVWLVVALLARDLVVALALVVAKSQGEHTPRVTMLGKGATMLLYIALPLAFLAFEWWPNLHAIAVGIAAVATGLYWAAGIGYVRDVAQRIRP